MYVAMFHTDCQKAVAEARRQPDATRFLHVVCRGQRQTYAGTVEGFVVVKSLFQAPSCLAEVACPGCGEKTEHEGGQVFLCASCVDDKARRDDEGVLRGGPAL